MVTLPQGDEKVRAVRSMFDAIAPRYDLVNRIMTFRLDVGWRRRSVRRLGLASGSVVLDLACGTGDLCRELQHQGLRPVGVDLSFGMLAAARTDAPLVEADALRLPVPDGSVHGVTCGFALRNLVGLDPFFAELARVVRPGGRIALLEVAEPPNPVLRWGHGIYFGQVVPRIGGLLSDGAAYRYLPKSVEYLPPPARLLSDLGAAGFTAVERHLLTGGIAQLITATREVPAGSVDAVVLARRSRQAEENRIDQRPARPASTTGLRGRARPPAARA
jgi:demethylmenaquinone methyltransferase/2-methoxy-6-polyprenyl-1,4-benzoquinol methylase